MPHHRLLGWVASQALDSLPPAERAQFKAGLGWGCTSIVAQVGRSRV
jgi:hypothetical protein